MLMLLFLYIFRERIFTFTEIKLTDICYTFLRKDLVCASGNKKKCKEAIIANSQRK